MNDCSERTGQGPRPQVTSSPGHVPQGRGAPSDDLLKARQLDAIPLQGLRRAGQGRASAETAHHAALSTSSLQPSVRNISLQFSLKDPAKSAPMCAFMEASLAHPRARRGSLRGQVGTGQSTRVPAAFGP